MARGDMTVTTYTIGVEEEILNRKENEAIALTLDFTSVSDTDADTGEKIVKAGTPVDKDGKPQKTTPWTGTIGILLHDVYESRPQGAVLKKAYINTTKAQSHSGCTYDAALVATLVNAGCRIVIENDTLVGTIPGAASE